jgi:hypothetical protein
MRRRGLPAPVTAAIIIAGFVFSLTVNWPGHLSYDSVMQLWEGRTGLYNNWHPPVMAWLLGAFDRLSPGGALFMAFDAALAFGSFLALTWIYPRVSWAAAGLAALVVLTPQMLLYQGIVWKDVLFADATLAGFVCLAWAGAAWLNRRLRYGLIAGAGAFLVLAALARQNGVLLLAAGAGALGWIAAIQAANGKRAAAAKYGAAFLFGGIAAMGTITAALDTRLYDRTGPAMQIERLEGYDIIGALALNPQIHFPAIERGDPLLSERMRELGVRFYNPERSDTLLFSPALQSALLNAKPGVMAQGWRELILRHPWTYLRVRAVVFRWVFLTPDLMACVPYYTGVDGPPDEMRHLGLSERFDDRDETLGEYAHKFLDTPVFSHAAWGAVAAAALVFLLRRRKPADIAMAGMLAGALLVTASYFVISIACDYRYLYGLDLSALAALFYLSLDRFGFLPEQK